MLGLVETSAKEEEESGGFTAKEASCDCMGMGVRLGVSNCKVVPLVEVLRLVAV